LTDGTGVAPAEEELRPGFGARVSGLALDLTPLRRRPAFRRLWLGQAVSFIGTEIAYVAVSYQLYRLTGSTLDVGLLALTHLVPLLTLTIVGGALADAVDRGRLMLVQQLGMVAGGAGLAANAALAHPRVWPLFAFETVTISFYSLGVGGQRALTPQLVPECEFVAASALNSTTSQLGAVVGPALAGVLIRYVDLSWIYLANVLSFGGTLAAVLLLPKLGAAAESDRPSLGSIAAGFRYLRRQPVILGFFLTDTNAMIFGMPLALFPAIAAHRFGDRSLVGYLYAAPAVGALGVSLVSGPLRRLRRQGLGVIVGATLWGVAIVLFGFSHRLWLGLLLLGAAGAADQISAVLRSAMLFSIVPNHLLGRLSGIEFMQVASAPSLGNVEAGALASATSIRFSIVSGGLACVVGCALLALAFPALRRYESRAAP
jgi:MFS family permease